MSDVKQNIGSESRPSEPDIARIGLPGYILQLYVAGHSANSVRAIASLRSICDEYLPGKYDLQVIDIYQQPQLAEIEDVIAVPTLIKQQPLPRRRLVGNMSDKEKVLLYLGIDNSRN